MFNTIKNYFAPKEGDLRVRDIIREIPEGMARSWGRSAWSGLSSITAGVVAPNRETTDFEKNLYGKEEQPTPTSKYNEAFSGEKGQAFAQTKVGKIAAPAIGFGIGAIQALDFTGTGSKAKSVKQVGNVFTDIASRASRSEIKAMERFVNSVELGAVKGVTKKAETLKFADDDAEGSFYEGMKLWDKYSDSMTSGGKVGIDVPPKKVADYFRSTLEARRNLPSRPMDIRRVTAAERAKVAQMNNVLDLNEYNVLDLKKATTPANKRSVVLNPNHYPPESKKIIEQALEEYRPVAEKRAGQRMTYTQLADNAAENVEVLKNYIGPEETNKAASLLHSTDMLVARYAEDHANALARGDMDAAKVALTKLGETVEVVNSHKSHYGYMLGSLGTSVKPKDMAYISEIMIALTKLGHKSEDVMKSINKMKDMNDPAEVFKVYREFEQAGLKDWINLIRYNSMLSSPLTHMINAASTLANSSTIVPLTRLVEGGFDFIAHNKNRTVFAGEVPAYVKGYVNAFSEATGNFMDVMKGLKRIEQPDLRRQVPIAQDGTAGAIYKTLAVPTRLLEGMDQFFMTLATKADMAALTYRESKGVSVANKLDKATETAKYSAFRSDLHSDKQGAVLDLVDNLTSLVESARNSKNPILYWTSNFTIPFVHTVMNIAKQGIEYSPAGFTTMVGAANKQEQLAKAVIGTSVATAVGLYGLSGRVTTAMPKDKNEAELWRKSGKQEYSIKIGDTWVQYSKLPPALAFPIASVASFQQAFKEKKIDQSTYDALSEGLAKTFAYYGDQSYFKGIGDIANAFSEGSSDAWAQLASNYPQQAVPFRALGGWLARLMDDTQRTIDGKANFAEKQLQLLALNIPVIREVYGEPKLDKQGEPIPALNRVRNAFSPLKMTDEDKRYAEFLNNYDHYSKINRDENRENYLERESALEMYSQIKEAEPEKKKQMLQDLAQSNPDMLKRVTELAKKDKGGMTPEEILIKNMGITARAEYVKNKISNAKSSEEKRMLLAHYMEVGILTKGVIDSVKQ